MGAALGFFPAFVPAFVLVCAGVGAGVRAEEAGVAEGVATVVEGVGVLAALGVKRWGDLLPLLAGSAGIVPHEASASATTAKSAAPACRRRL